MIWSKIFDILGGKLRPYCQVKQRKEIDRKCYEHEFCVILKHDLTVIECHLFVSDPWVTELH